MPRRSRSACPVHIPTKIAETAVFIGWGEGHAFHGRFHRIPTEMPLRAVSIGGGCRPRLHERFSGGQLGFDHGVGHPLLLLDEEKYLTVERTKRSRLRPLCCVAESGRRGDQGQLRP
jgi:hypothetical protein